MANYRITIVNEHFEQSASLQAPDNVRAWQKAIESAIDIAKNQVSHGNPFFGAEVILEQGKTLIGRYVVSIGAMPLKE